MKIEELKSRYEESFIELESLIATALGQIIQKEVSIKKEIYQETDLNPVIGAEEFPKIVISYTSGTGPKESRNLITIRENFVLNFYAWMINDEPAESVEDDHFDGLSETVQQVFGQLKMAVADDQASFQLNNLNVFKAESAEELAEFIPVEEGIACSYDLSVDEEVHQVTHYFWVKELQDVGEDAAEQLLADAGATVDVMPAEFGPLTSGNGGMDSDRNVEVLMDVELEVSVEIDRKMMLISDLLKLGKGSIVELEKSAGEPLDIFVNGRKFAEGEVL